MGTDLLRSQQRWKDTLMEIRHQMADLQNTYGYSAENIRSWRGHFDRQLYKALEHQFALGLEKLNEQLPEIKVDLIMRQDGLSFRYYNFLEFIALI